jgi:hypothetical protein
MEYENQIGEEGYKFTTSVFLLHLSHFILSLEDPLSLSLSMFLSFSRTGVKIHPLRRSNAVDSSFWWR